LCHVCFKKKKSLCHVSLTQLAESYIIYSESRFGLRSSAYPS
jgi:hypothetical protein